MKTGKLIILIIIVLLPLSCVSKKTGKDLNIPDNSFWIGGDMGGYWFSVNSYTDSSVNLNIYNGNGLRIVKNDFKLCNECSDIKFNFEHLEKSIVAYNGTYIMLDTKSNIFKGRCYLYELKN
ncbi:hypothetical protein BH10BAC5_BH10BAC5_06060 [soil metagenome]